MWLSGLCERTLAGLMMDVEEDEIVMDTSSIRVKMAF